MADDADRAEDLIEAQMETRIAMKHAQAAQEARSIAGVGVCLWCGEKVPYGRFCGADCRDEWQARCNDGSP